MIFTCKHSVREKVTGNLGERNEAEHWLKLKSQNPNHQPPLHAIRQAKALPLLAQFKAWLIKSEQSVLPKTKLGEAVTYCLNQWDKLTVYPIDGRLSIDNNRAERAIKPFVIGRKNWLFSKEHI